MHRDLLGLLGLGQGRAGPWGGFLDIWGNFVPVARIAGGAVNAGRGGGWGVWTNGGAWLSPATSNERHMQGD